MVCFPPVIPALPHWPRSSSSWCRPVWHNLDKHMSLLLCRSINMLVDIQRHFWKYTTCENKSRTNNFPITFKKSFPLPQLTVHVSIQRKEWVKSTLQRLCLLPLPSAMLPHCWVLWCTPTFPLSCCSGWFLLGHTQHNLGHRSSCPCQELSAQRWKHNPVKLTVVNGAWSQDTVNLFYSILSFLNEAPSYVTGHLHLGVDAKWFFNTKTAPWEIDKPIISEWAGVQKRPSGDSRKL